MAAGSLRELPLPGPDAGAHSERVSTLIRDAIAQAGGRIGFDRFMALALYAPGVGYYSGGSQKFGAEGDFVTAPELTPLFSRCVARQCAQVLERLEGGAILEFGAGTGRLACDLLGELERLGRLPEHYYILDVSGELKARQQRLLTEQLPHLVARVQWLTCLPAPGFRGVVIANEVLDAIPVHRFRIKNSQPLELSVTWTEGRFSTVANTPRAPRLAKALAALQEAYHLPEGYESELNLGALDWVRSLADFLEAGVALLIDYGFPAREYYHPQRGGGTLMCHYRHRAHPDPFVFVGLQDITAHVDFSAVAAAGVEAGLHVGGFTTQANFLLGNGLLDMVEANADDRARLQMAAQVKRLLMPGEMGELFKVLALTRGAEGPLAGFAIRDDRTRL